MILEFETEQDALYFMENLDQIAQPSKGYEQWDVVKESPEGTFFIFSPTGDPRFPDWKGKIVAECVERDLPEEWLLDGE